MKQFCAFFLLVPLHLSPSYAFVDRFEMVFHVSHPKLDSIAAALHVQSIGTPMCVYTICGHKAFGSFAWCSSESTYLVMLDRQGDVARKTNMVHGLADTLGASFSASLYDSRIFLTGAKSHGYYFDGDSLILTKNPWKKETMEAQFPKISFGYGIGPWGDTIPSFRMYADHLLAISNEGVLQILDTSGKQLYSKRLRLLADGQRFDEFITFWIAPIIGIFDGELFLWDKDRLVVCDTSRGSVVAEPLDSLFQPEKCGRISREAEGTASAYFVDGNDLYVFVETDTGFFAFKRRRRT